jgi:DNA-binding GntR family transcriptional regulator
MVRSGHRMLRPDAARSGPGAACSGPGGAFSRLQIHMRAIRQGTIGDENRMAHLVVDHAHILEALETRDADAVEARVRQHAFDPAEHVRLNVSHLK